MKLIEEIESRRDSKGILRKWGKFLCVPCGQIVEKHISSGKRDKSCGCSRYQLIKENHVRLSGKQHPLFGKIAWNKGVSPTKETREKQSNAKKGHFVSENTKQKIGSGNKGKIVLRETREKQSNAKKGYIISEEVRQKISKSLKGKYTGELAANWQNGKSFEEYGMEFNKELKQQILERDNYTCQDPNCDGDHKRLDIHHIDYDKKNNLEENLITLCNSCHAKTNGKNNRPFWTNYYQNIMRIKCNLELL